MRYILLGLAMLIVVILQPAIGYIVFNQFNLPDFVIGVTMFMWLLSAPFQGMAALSVLSHGLKTKGISDPFA